MAVSRFVYLCVSVCVSRGGASAHSGCHGSKNVSMRYALLASISGVLPVIFMLFFFFFFGCADSLEDQEGGAMYISCDVSNGGPVEPETGYVPNNPLFGLALDSPQVSPGILFRFRLNISGNLRAFGCACFVERT